jgi:hypothetical protein
MLPKIVHVLWSPVGPIVGYSDPTKAWSHARTMLGVDVAQIEVRDDLPEVVRDDIHTEWEANDEDDTPRIVDIKVDDIDES